MPEAIDICDKSPSLRKSTQRRRLETLILTTVGVFALAALVWPLNVRGYHAVARLELAVDSPEQHQVMLQRVLPLVMQRVLTDQNIRSIVDQLPEPSEASSSVLDGKQPDWIRQRISIGCKHNGNQTGSLLKVVFNGQGTKDEKQFIGRLASSLAKEMGPELMTQLSLHHSDRSNASNPYDYDRAARLIDQVEEKLSIAKQQAIALSLANESAQDDGARPEQQSAFRTIGHTRTLNQPSVGQLKETLDNVEIEPLRRVLGQLQQEHAGMSLLSSSLAKFDSNQVQQVPVGAVPPQEVVMLLLFLSLCTGCIVALNVQPFTESGFEDVNQVARELGVPVVATFGSLNEKSVHDSAPQQRAGQATEEPWANRATVMAGTVLLGLGVLCAGFWLVDPAVREAFGEGPFHGIARIVWTFTAPG